ncbi:hypothetical protein PRZ48_003937 [Zasmidium cellare]|uniref:Uncharacterized protein n=1 Tax=Zasmidium cellare TaxID=395010 RepID=A0ABR0EWU5_ZASCE|nr:hypothetical protein PRZ48_003937 [Zasmidium cellare]
MPDPVVDSAITIIQQNSPPIRRSPVYARLCKKLKRVVTLVFPSREPPKLYKCGYCYDDKPAKAFKYPFFCRVHLPQGCVKKLKRDRVCYECLCESVTVQLETRPASKMGCPDCRMTWTTPDIYYLLPYEKRDLYAQKVKEEMSVQPYHPPSADTLQILISQGTKLCPFCGAAIQKRSGCYGVICGQCHGAFPYDRAKLLKEVHQQWTLEREGEVQKATERWQLLSGGDDRSWVGTSSI